MIDDPAGDRRGADEDEPGDRDVEPGEEGDAAGDDREHALAGPATDDLARLLDHPALLHDVRLELGVERRRPTCRTWAGRRPRCSPRPCRAELTQLLERVLLGGADRSARVERSPRLLDRVAASAVPTSMPTLLDSPSSPRSSRNEIRPRDARSSIAVVSARRDVPPSMTNAPDAAVRSGGGAGMRIEGSSR